MAFMLTHGDDATQRCQDLSTNVVSKRNVGARVGDVPKHPVSLWLIDERKRHGWKAEEVARRLRDAGVQAEDGTYRVWEAGRKPKDDAIRAMETLFGTTAPKDEPTGAPDLTALLDSQARLTAAIVAQTAAITRLAAQLERSQEEGPEWADAVVRAVLAGLQLGAASGSSSPRPEGAVPPGTGGGR